MLTRQLAVALVVVLLLAGTRAVANPPGGSCPPDSPMCSVAGDLPGAPGGGSAGGGEGGSGGGGPCVFEGEAVPCELDDFGSYVGGGCYARQVPAPDPDPHGGAGAWYQRTCGIYGGTLIRYEAEWSLLPPGGVGPTPEELAREALAKIRLEGAAIGTAPGAGGAGLVGLPVWLWTAVTPNTWGPITASATAGALTVTITGRAVRIVWSMGDGSTVTCANPGTPYESRYADHPSPTCGHVYHQPSRIRSGGVYRISTVTYWRVDWAGGGESGVIDTTRESATTLAVEELQVVTS